MPITPIVDTDPVSPLEDLFNTQATSLEAEMAAVTAALAFKSTADLTSLHAITATAGLAYVVIEGGALFIGNGTIFVQETAAIFATAAARNTAYAKASGAYLVANARCIVTATSSWWPMVYNGANWQKLGLWKPTAAVATNGTATINDDGSITCVWTAAGLLTLTNCIPPLALTDITDSDISWVSSAGQFLTVKQASGGTVDPTTSGYDYHGFFTTQAGAPTAVPGNQNGATWTPGLGSASSIALEYTWEIRHALDSTKPTRIKSDGHVVNVIGSNEEQFILKLTNRATTVFDGFQFSASGAGTVNLKFRPRA